MAKLLQNKTNENKIPIVTLIILFSNYICLFLLTLLKCSDGNFVRPCGSSWETISLHLS